MTTNVTLNNEVFKITVADAIGLTGPQGPIGPSGPSGNAQNVTTVAAFQAASFDANTQVVNIQGYTSVGIGGFRVRRVASQPAHGWRFRSVDRYLPSGSTDNTNGGWWEGCPDQTVTPYQFGAVSAAHGVSTPTADASSAFQAFFNYINNYKVDNCVIAGNFGLATALTYDCLNQDSELVTSHIHWDARFWDISVGGLTCLIEFRNCVHQVWTGRIDGFGAGSSTYNSRKTLDIFLFSGHMERLQADFIQTAYALRWGMNIADLNADWNIKTHYSNYCGASDDVASGLKYTVVGVVNSGAGLAARSTVQISAALPAHITTAGDAVCHTGNAGGISGGGAPGFITNIVDSTHIEIYPQIDTLAYVGLPFWVIYGGGTKVIGADSSQCSFGFIDSLSCGVGYWPACWYPGDVGTLQVQNCGMGVVLADYTASVQSKVNTGNIGEIYAEGNLWTIFTATSNQTNFTIGNIIDGQGLGKQVGLTTSNKANGLTLLGLGGLFPTAGELVPGTGVSLAPNDAPQPVLVRLRDVSTVSLVEDTDKSRLWGYTGYVFAAVGTGVNGAPTSVTFAPNNAAWKINGGAAGASLVITGFTAATAFYIFADYANKNWVVGYYIDSAPARHITNSGASPLTILAADMTNSHFPVITLTAALGAGGTIVTDTAANLIAASPTLRGLNHYTIRIINASAGAFAWTLTGGANVTISGTATIAQNTWREFTVEADSFLANVTFTNAGAGTL